MYRNKKITQSAQGKTCTMRIPGVCNRNPETTVWAHSNFLEDGKGMGVKAHDIYGAYMCSACHDEFDGRTHKVLFEEGEMREAFHRAMKRSLLILLEEGVIK